METSRTVMPFNQAPPPAIGWAHRDWQGQSRPGAKVKLKIVKTAFRLET
jgi:hypothetical protein